MHWKDALTEAAAAAWLLVSVALLVAILEGAFLPGLMSLGARLASGFGFGGLAVMVAWGAKRG